MNKKYLEFLRKVKEHSTIIIHRHSRPDGDAIGSQIGLKEALKATYPYKKIYAVGDINEKFRFLGEMDVVEDNQYKDALVFVLDSGDEVLVNDERFKNGRYMIRIDHHIAKNSWGDLEILDSKEISCASIIADIIFETHLKQTNLGAEALFTGIVTDSGRFRYSGTSSKTFKTVAKLMDYDFDVNEIYNNIYIDDLDIIKLRARLTLNFKVTKGNVAYLVNTQEDIKKYKTDIFTISRGMVSVMSGIKNIDIWVNFTEDENQKILTEIRSSKYNINPVAVKYGGGGHKMASGCTLNSMDDIDNVLKDLEKVMEQDNGN